jgi:hypothetical protein
LVSPDGDAVKWFQPIPFPPRQEKKKRMHLNSIENIIKLLRGEQKDGHLQFLNLDNDGELFDILKKKSDAQSRLINALVINNKYQDLNRILREWNLPAKSCEEQLKTLKSMGIQSFREAREKGITPYGECY